MQVLYLLYAELVLGYHFLICGDSSLKVLCLVKTALKKFCQVLFYLDYFQGRYVLHFILAKADCHKAGVMLTVVKILSLMFKGFESCLKYIYIYIKEKIMKLKLSLCRLCLLMSYCDVCE